MPTKNLNHMSIYRFKGMGKYYYNQSGTILESTIN